MWTENRQQSGSNTSMHINAKFFDDEYSGNSGFTSAQLLASVKRHVDSRRHWPGVHSRDVLPLIFVGMMNELESHTSSIQQ